MGGVTADVGGGGRPSGLPPESVEYDRLLIALGRVVQESAQLENVLRMAFCALVGSKYAAIVAAGQQVNWLIEQCRAVAREYREISDEHRNALLEVLGACRQANDERRRLVHHVWGHGPGGTRPSLVARIATTGFV